MPKAKTIDLSVLREGSNGIVDPILSKLKKGNLLFVSKHGNADRVLLGEDLLARLEIVEFDDLLIQAKVPKGIKLKPDTHIFYSTTGDKGIACGYIESVSKGIAYITGTNSEYIKKLDKKVNIKASKYPKLYLVPDLDP